MDNTPRSDALQSGNASGQSSHLFSRVNIPHDGKSTTGVLAALRVAVQNRIIGDLAAELGDSTDEVIRKQVHEILDEVIDEKHLVISRTERADLLVAIERDVLGLGPLEELLNDHDVSDIMINSAKKVYVEKNGKVQKSTITFEDNDQIMKIVGRIVRTIGRRIDEATPMVDARLLDGSRVHIIIPPVSLKGPTVTIRKADKKILQTDEMVENLTVSRDMMQFMEACVHARMNIAVSGGGGVGKTTTLNALSSFIPDGERIVTIEDSAELKLRQRHVVPLESRPPNIEGKGRVAIRDLVINSLRMRPDRIVIGECRGGEALDMLQAMNTGHDGSLTTIHANSAHDVVSRLETLVLMAGTDLPSRAIREQIASAINIVIHQVRLRDGSRRISMISEITGMSGEDVQMEDIFVYEQEGIAEDGHVIGHHRATGYVPQCLERIIASGEHLPESIFHQNGME